MRREGILDPPEEKRSTFRFPLDTWKFEGTLHLWHYTEPAEGFEGWHLHADAIACVSLVDGIDRMLAAERLSLKQIPVSVPGRMLVSPGRRWESAASLSINFKSDHSDDLLWHIEETEANAAVLAVGAAKLQEFRKSLVGLPKNQDDFSLGPETSHLRRRGQATEMARLAAQRLWFWSRVE